MIAQDALAGLEAGLITKAEALEQAGVEEIEAIRDRAEDREGGCIYSRDDVFDRPVRLSGEPNRATFG
jgi:hypothetical protein